MSLCGVIHTAFKSGKQKFKRNFGMQNRGKEEENTGEEKCKKQQHTGLLVFLVVPQLSDSQALH